MKLADSQRRARRMETASSCQQLFIKNASSSSTKLKSNWLSTQYSADSFSTVLLQVHMQNIHLTFHDAAPLLFLHLKQSSGDFIQTNKQTNSKNLTVVSPPPVEVLRLPAVCRQVQRMWTSDHGYGECVLLPSRCVFCVCVCRSEPGDL